MTWYHKEDPTPFDDKPIEGLQFLDGDVLAWLMGSHWVAGQKYPMVEFPSGHAFDIWEDSISRIIHIYGEMDLLLHSSRDEALKRANAIAEDCGYMLKPLAEAGDARAEETFARALDVAGRIVDSDRRASALRHIAAGERERALQVAASIEDRDWRVEALQGIARSIAEAHQMAAALASIKQQNLTNFMQWLGNCAESFEAIVPGLAVKVITQAARIVGWQYPDWTAIYEILVGDDTPQT